MPVDCMRIGLYVRAFPAASDYNRDYTEMAVRLATAGHEVTAIMVGDPEIAGAADAEEYHGVRLVRVPGEGSSVGAMIAARRALKDLLPRLDVFMAVEWWNPVTHLLARTSLASGVPTVISPWASLNPHALGRDRRRLAKLAAIKALSAYYGRRRPWLQLYAPVDADHAARLGLDWPYFLAPLGIYDDYGEASATFDAGAVLNLDLRDKRTLLFNARLDLYQKGYDYLVEGFRMAADAKGPGFRTILILSGRDPEAPIPTQIESARRMAHPLVERGQALFLGELEARARRDLIAHSDGFVYPSRVDGPPRPLREALARGTPLLVTHETGLGAWVEEFAAGVAIQKPTAEAVRDAVLAFDALSEAQLATLRDGARRLADRLSWSRCWRDYESGLARVASSRGN